MTKAERIFKDTRYTCYAHMRDWGKKTNPNGRPIGFTNLTYGENESVCIRTCNDIQKLINSAKKMCKMDLHLGIYTEEKYNNEMFVLEMVQVTLENKIKAINEFKAW